MMVRQGEIVREVIAVVHAVEEDGTEMLGYWVGTPDGGRALWLAQACEVVEP